MYKTVIARIKELDILIQYEQDNNFPGGDKWGELVTCRQHLFVWGDEDPYGIKSDVIIFEGYISTLGSV